MKNPMLHCCFTLIVFIELTLTVAFLLIRKILDDWFAGKLGGWGILRNGGDPSNVWMILKWGANTPPFTYYALVENEYTSALINISQEDGSNIFELLQNLGINNLRFMILKFSRFCLIVTSAFILLLLYTQVLLIL